MITKPGAVAPFIEWLVEPTYDDDGVQRSAGLDQLGREIGDPTPVQPPLGLSVHAGDDTHTVLKNLFIKEREAFRAAVEREQFESEDEANDFLVADDLFPPGNESWEDVHNFPVEEPGSVANGPSLASEPVKGETPQQDGAPPATFNRQIVSGGFGPDVTPGTPPTGRQTDVSGMQVGDGNRKVG